MTSCWHNSGSFLGRVFSYGVATVKIIVVSGDFALADPGESLNRL